MTQGIKNIRARFQEDHPNTPISDKNFGVLGPGSLVEVKQDNRWLDGIVDKILYAIKEKQVTFFIRLGYGLVVSIPYREGELFPDRLRPKK